MKQQQGIALITILIMVALATIIAATIAKRQQQTYASTAYLMHQNQALYYAKSAEAFFSEILVQDAESNAKNDHLQETWAQPMPAFPIEGGTVSGRLIDESGKFNLNTLIKDDGVTPNPEAKIFFEALLERVGLTADLTEAVIDWQDTDDLSSGAMGAESNYYGSLRQPYLAANAPFNHVDELKQVRGFEGEKFNLIAPYVTAVPDRQTKININTAPALLLAVLDEKLDPNAVEQAQKLKMTNMESFASVGELWSIEPFAQVETSKRQIATNVMDVSSNYFQAQIEVVLDQRKRQFTSYLYRKDKQVLVHSRSLAPY